METQRPRSDKDHSSCAQSDSLNLSSKGQACTMISLRAPAEFGPPGDSSNLYTSVVFGGEIPEPVVDKPLYFIILTTYISFLVVISFGHFQDFVARWFKPHTYRRIKPQNGYASLHVVLLDRTTKDNVHYELTGKSTNALNMSSYNYLGFAKPEDSCADLVKETIYRDGISMTGPYPGTTKLLVEVEDQIARLVGKDAAIVFSIGFATNNGLSSACQMLSEAAIEVFAHNNMTSLEEKLKQAIFQDQQRTHRPKKKYKFYTFIDKAHLIGAIGSRGRGVCDYFKVDPAEVDILMGTFTKSFGANAYSEAPTLPILAQISSSFRLIAEEDPLYRGQGFERMQSLTFNLGYLRLGLKRLGFIMPAFSKEMLQRKISVVVVTYPATPLGLSRVRLCVSAAHTKDDLDRVLEACDEVGEALQLKLSSGKAGDLKEPRSDGTISPEVIKRGVRDAKLTLY
ncbi:pyridoxal phosphate-dependent transferase [Aspergillus spinulosporus]